jgi:hypothetical protein
LCGEVGLDSLLSGPARESVGEAVKDDAGLWAGSPSVCSLGNGMLFRSGEIVWSEGGGKRVAVSSMLMVGALGRGCLGDEGVAG